MRRVVAPRKPCLAYTRADTWELGAGLILEGPERWGVRPVAEGTFFRELGEATSGSGLLGLIWEPRDDLSFDLGQPFEDHIGAEHRVARFEPGAVELTHGVEAVLPPVGRSPHHCARTGQPHPAGGVDLHDLEGPQLGTAGVDKHHPGAPPTGMEDGGSGDPGVAAVDLEGVDRAGTQRRQLGGRRRPILALGVHTPVEGQRAVGVRGQLDEHRARSSAFMDVVAVDELAAPDADLNGRIEGLERVSHNRHPAAATGSLVPAAQTGRMSGERWQPAPCLY